MNAKVYNIEWGSIWRVIAAIILVIAAYFAIDAIVILTLAIVISLAFDAPVDFLNRRFKFPRIMAAALVFLAGILLTALIISFIFPIIIFEFSSLIGQLPGATTDTLFKDFSPLVDLVSQDLSLVNVGQIVDVIFRGTAPIARTIGDALRGLAFAISVLIISFYLTLSQDGVGRFLRDVLPEKLEDPVLRVYYRSKTKIGRWFQTQILLSIVIGVMVSLGLWILGVRYSLAIGLLSAVLAIMPVVGSVFAGAVGTLIAFSSSFSLGIYALLLFIIIQQIEGNILMPLFMKKAVSIHPVAVLFSLMVGYQLFGIIGMIIAVPALVVIQDILEERLEEKRSAREARDREKK